MFKDLHPIPYLDAFPRTAKEGGKIRQFAKDFNSFVLLVFTSHTVETVVRLYVHNGLIDCCK